MLVEATPVAIVVVDRHTVIALANRHAQILFGYRSGELTGKDASLLVPERFRAGYNVFRDEYLLAPSSRPMDAGHDLFGLRKDGTEFPLKIGLNPISTGHGAFVLAAVVDISERLGAEKRNHAAEQMRLVIDGMAQGMVVTDRAGNITLVNSEVERIFGYLRPELLDRSVEMLLPDRLRKAHMEQRNSRADAYPGHVEAENEFYGLHKDGRELALELGLRPMTTANGEFILATFIDITERKHAEQLRRVEVTLEISEARVRRQAKRMESLWQIVNTSDLSGHDLVLAMLSDATAAMHLGQASTATLGHIDGLEYVVDAVARQAGSNGVLSQHFLDAGSRIALSETVFGRDLTTGRTQSWQDCSTISNLPKPARVAGLRGQIATKFVTNDTTYFLTLSSLEPPSGVAFGADDYEYIEVLGSFFSHYLEQEQVERSLRNAEFRTRQHAQRLAALWQVANNPQLRGQTLILAMLRQAATVIRPQQLFEGLLGRIEGNEVVLIGVGAEPGNGSALSKMQIGRRTPLDKTMLPDVGPHSGL